MNLFVSEFNRALLNNHIFFNLTHTKVSLTLCGLLAKAGYITSYVVSKSGKLFVQLAVYKNKIIPNRLKRLSRPGHRVFYTTTTLNSPIVSKRVYLLSTTRGYIINDINKPHEVGGEVVFEIL